MKGRIWTYSIRDNNGKYLARSVSLQVLKKLYAAHYNFVVRQRLIANTPHLMLDASGPRYNSRETLFQNYLR